MNSASAGSPGSRPQGRYGERRPSRALIAGLAVVGAALLGWLIWAALAAANPDTRSAVLGFRVLDDRRVQVRFEVVADKAAAVTCSVRAQDSSGEIVGLTGVDIGPGPEDRREAETVLSTRGRAVTATVAGCRLQTDD